MGDDAIPIAQHEVVDDALDDLIDYRRMYTGRRFELELWDDGRQAPWRVVVKLRRRRRTRWSLFNRSSRQMDLRRD
jgi:hypothetical protein